MNKIQYLLSKVAEECSETAQRAIKAQVFGLDEKQPRQDLSNADRLILEFNDLLAVMEMLMEEYGVESGNWLKLHRYDLVENKKGKMFEYMQYIRELGILKD